MDRSLPGFTVPGLLWKASHEPVLFKRVAHVMLPKDYLVYWLTGKLTTDKSVGSGTSWLNVVKRCWSEQLLLASGMSAGQLPALFEGSQLVGKLKGQVAALLHLAPLAWFL